MEDVEDHNYLPQNQEYWLDSLQYSTLSESKSKRNNDDNSNNDDINDYNNEDNNSSNNGDNINPKNDIIDK